MSEKPKGYSFEFKEQAAKMMADSSRPIAQVARELGLNHTTLGLWGVPRTRRCVGPRLSFVSFQA